MAMTGRLWLAGLLAGAALPASLAHTQGNESAAPRATNIIVTGRTHEDRRAVEKQARAITRSALYYREPLAQFQTPICPGILGLPVETASLIVDRIRYNAERVGVPVAKEGKCEPNILVAFVPNGQATLRAMAKSSSHLFKDMPTPDFEELMADAGPVHSWTETAIRSRQGDIVQGDSSRLASPPTLNVAQSQSHIFLAHRIDIIRATILMDLQAVNGLSVVQLADYATMRSFARTRAVEGDEGADTILGLFDPAGARPGEMTSFDLAYLRTIYGDIPNINASSKLAGINRQLRKQEEREKGEEDDGK